MNTNLSVKTLLVGLFALLALGTVEAQAFLAPTNPAPQVQLAWNPVAAASTYSLYVGVGSGQYTNKVTGISATNTSYTMPTRGVKYFFAVTCTDSHGLESTFSNEVNYTPPSPPAAPVMQPITVLTVQWSPSPAGVFADAGMNWTLTADQANQYFKLRMDRSPVTMMAMARPAGLTAHPAPTPPPLPSK